MIRIASPGAPPSGAPDLPPDPQTAPPPDALKALLGAPPGALPMAPQGKFDAEKVSPETAGYQEGPSPRCGDCHHFDGQSTCEVVSGQISPDAWCCLFEPGGSPDETDQSAEPTDAEGASDEGSEGQPPQV